MRVVTLNRRQFLQGSVAMAGLSVLPGCELPPPRLSWSAKVPRVGLLATTSNQERDLPAFFQGLRDLGYVDGETIKIEPHIAELSAQFSGIAPNLVRSAPDVILASTTPATQAMKQHTTTIPIVMASSGNAVELGLVASLARPGGNVTGMTNDFVGTVTKQLDLIIEAVPGLIRLALFWTPNNPASAPALRAIEEIARTRGRELHPFEVRSPDELPVAFAGVIGSRAEALMVMTGVQSPQLDPLMVEFSHQRRLPAIFPFTESVAMGGLMCFAGSIYWSFYRSAAFVDKILKGAKPADLPVERIDRFQFMINLKTAEALGLIIPQSVLAQATDIIQ